MIRKAMEYERRVVLFLERHCLGIYAFCIFILSIVIRISLLPYVSDDMDGYLLSWYGQIEQLGRIHALNVQVGNYSVVYQTIIAILTYLPFSPIVKYKMVSILFDYILALTASAFVYDKENRNTIRYAIMTFAVVVLSPVVFMNSGMWGQCDSIYVSFVLMSLLCLKKDKVVKSFILLGVAFSFKLQAVFILPLFIYAYVKKKEISLLHFLEIPLTMIIMCIPAYIEGRGFKGFISPYYYQTESCDKMYFNYPSFWSIICEGTESVGECIDAFKIPAIILTVGILASAMVFFIKKECDLTEDSILYLSFIFAFICVFFLPGMHERYAYLIEIVAIIGAIKNKKVIPIAIWMSVSSMVTYGAYFFKYSVNIRLLGILNLVALISCFALLFSSKREKQSISR